MTNLSKKDKIEDINTNSLYDTPLKMQAKALKVLAKAKELEKNTKTKAVVSADGKTVRFVKIKE